MVKKTVCLNMIVKNEGHVIERCLSTVVEFIDYWVIFDTGSTDNTKEIIRDRLKHIPGELHESSWVNFAHNRNQVLQIARNKADYSLIIDADEQLVVDDNFCFPRLSKDIYSINVKEVTYSEKWFLINHQIDWKWVGVMHETITADHIRSKELLQNCHIFSFNDGARSKNPQKIYHDALILEEYLRHNPDDFRSRFYAGICYYNAGVYDKAAYHFSLRSQKKGDDRELFIAMLLRGKMKQYFQGNPEEVIQLYQQACAVAPHRAEGWFYLGSYYQQLLNFELSYHVLKNWRCDTGCEPFYQENEIYEWKMHYYLARACALTQRSSEVLDHLSKVISCKYLPDDVKMETEKNLNILKDKQFSL